MKIKGIPLARLLRLTLLQGLLVVFLLSFALAVHPTVWLPTFGGQEAASQGEIRTFSVFDLLRKNEDLVKSVFKAGFPIVQYLENHRYDEEIPSFLSYIAGWFLGFVPKNMWELAATQLPGGLTACHQDPVPVAEELEKDWGIMPVLYSLPPGEGVQASVGIGDKPMIAIYHTHATESYLPDLGKKGPENAFTSDMTKSVVKVGEMFLSELEKRYRIPCIHSKTVHDEESRAGAYCRSETTIKAIQNKYPSCEVLLDLHRDSQPRSITAVKIRDKQYARILLVIGTNNPNWVKNYEFARTITSYLEDAYPGISRGILYASANYNQNYSPKALVVEVGGVDNTLAECKNSMEALAWAVAATLLPAVPAKP